MLLKEALLAHTSLCSCQPIIRFSSVSKLKIHSSFNQATWERAASSELTSQVVAYVQESLWNFPVTQHQTCFSIDNRQRKNVFVLMCGRRRSDSSVCQCACLLKQAYQSQQQWRRTGCCRRCQGRTPHWLLRLHPPQHARPPLSLWESQYPSDRWRTTDSHSGALLWRFQSGENIIYWRLRARQQQQSCSGLFKE